MGRSQSEPEFRTLANDQRMLPLPKGVPKGVRKALVDASKLWQPGQEGYISICFQDGKPWSLSGTDSMNKPSGYGGKEMWEISPSMSLGWTDPPNGPFTWKGVTYPLSDFENEYRLGCGFSISCNPDGATILHEFLHALGAKHEHQNTEGAGWLLNPAAVYSDKKNYCGDSNYDPNIDCDNSDNWDNCVCRAQHNVLDNYACRDAEGGKILCESVTAYDNNSVMLYSFPNEWFADYGSPGFVNPTRLNYSLSSGDKYWLNQKYPITSGDRPKLHVVFYNGRPWQKAWVEKLVMTKLAPNVGIDFTFETREDPTKCGPNTPPPGMDMKMIGTAIGIIVGSFFGLGLLAFLLNLLYDWVKGKSTAKVDPVTGYYKPLKG